MIGYALFDLNMIKWGSHIRPFELSRNLGVELVHGRFLSRPLKFMKSVPKAFLGKHVFIFGAQAIIIEKLFLQGIKVRGVTIIYDAADIPYLQKIYFTGSKIVDVELMKRFHALIEVADVLLVISPTFLKLMDKQLIKNKRVLIVPNASNPRFFRRTELPKSKNIVYVGGYAHARGVDDLVEAFKILRRKDQSIRLFLVGLNMPLYNIEGVVVLRNKFYKDMPKIYSNAYVVVIPHKKNPYMDSALPIKLFDAMPSARPVIVTDCLEMRRIVEKERCGIVVESNASSLAEAIEYILYNPRIAQEMGIRGREAILKRHSWAHRAITIMNFLNRLENS